MNSITRTCKAQIHIRRAVASLTVPGGQELHFPHFFPQILINFSSNFTYFLPHFGPPGVQVAHPGWPWLRHCIHDFVVGVTLDLVGSFMICLTVIVSKSGTQMRVRDSSATRIFLKKKKKKKMIKWIIITTKF